MVVAITSLSYCDDVTKHLGHDSKASRSTVTRNYLEDELKSVLKKARDVVDDDAERADKHLQPSLSHSTNSDRLKRPADRHVTVERDNHRYPDCPHLTDVNQWPHIHLSMHTSTHCTLVVVVVFVVVRPMHTYMYRVGQKPGLFYCNYRMC